MEIVKLEITVQAFSVSGVSTVSGHSQPLRFIFRNTQFLYSTFKLDISSSAIRKGFWRIFESRNEWYESVSNCEQSILIVRKKSLTDWTR